MRERRASRSFGAGRVARAAFAAFLTFAPAVAYADVTHVVARGHTVEAIAHRYHVPVKTILEANHIKDGNRLRPGDELKIPGVKDGAKGKLAAAEKKPVTYAARPKTPGVLHVTRLATSESQSVKVADSRGKLSTSALKTLERLMRSGGGISHAIAPRLVSLLTVVSNHFGSRPMQVVSGYRPYSPRQHTPHSRHNVGNAIDFRVVGVPNEVVRDYCRSLKNVGVGYYPNSTFVHLDAREAPAFWVDYSKPGEPPRYNAANVEADEGTSDVANDARGLDVTPPAGNTPPPPATDAQPLDQLPGAGGGEAAPTAGELFMSAAAGVSAPVAEPQE